MRCITLSDELEQFAYVASHDLQEPLRKIKTFASLINERFKDPSDTFFRAYLNKIIYSANRMSSLIKRFAKSLRHFGTNRNK